MKLNNISEKGFRGFMAMFFLVIVLGFSACTKKFESLNADPTGIANNNLQVGTLFIPIEQQIFQSYQIAQNLNADCYAGYSCPPQSFGRTLYNMNYVFVDGWNQSAFNGIYTGMIGPLKNKIANLGIQKTKPDFWAIALILQVEAIDRVTDKFGPAPYSKVGTSLITIPYDSQQSIYQQMFLQLDTASLNLNAYITANPGTMPFANSDAVYGGDYVKWLKLANSLRLRLAMHIVKVDPATAQLQGEKALSAPGGLLSLASDNAAVGESTNDYNQITNSYGDNRMNASMESYLVGYNDPRLPVYFLPVNGDPSQQGPVPDAYAGKYLGIHLGADVPAKPFYSGYSCYNFDVLFTSTAPELFMSAAEVWFLKAEAGLRNWAGAGDVQTNYNTGIQTSMNQNAIYGVTSAAATAYLNDAKSQPIAYVDPKNAVNNTPQPSAITIAWDPAAGNEAKLERIITQKWIAMFPEGQEAWTEFRRTGYPKLFPVVNNNSGGTIDSKIQVRRIPYPLSEGQTNAPAYAAGVTLLAGPDNGGTRLWWDKNVPNF